MISSFDFTVAPGDEDFFEPVRIEGVNKMPIPAGLLGSGQIQGRLSGNVAIFVQIVGDTNLMTHPESFFPDVAKFTYPA